MDAMSVVLALSRLAWVAAFAGILLFVVWLVVRVARIAWGGPGAGGRSDGSDRDEPLDILRARFARGEISQSEFEERRRLLGSSGLKMVAAWIVGLALLLSVALILGGRAGSGGPSSTVNVWSGKAGPVNGQEYSGGNGGHVACSNQLPCGPDPVPTGS